MTSLVRACVVLAGLFMSGASLAQTYPSGPLRLVVPFPPGGGTDIMARAFAQKLSEAWIQPVVVENRGGANGTIGAAAVAKAPPDGHTLLVVPSGFAVNPSIYKLPFDSLKDLAPVTQLASGPLVLISHNSFPPTTLKQLIAFVKAHPRDINYGSSGNGSPPHLATELLKLMTGISMQHVPYKGAGPAAVALMSGEIPIYFMSALQSVPHVKAKRARALGVTSEKRFAPLPDVPTMAEGGVPGYVYTNWYGLLVQGGTPRPTVDKLQNEAARILHQPELKERLAGEGATVVASSPDQFTAFLRQQIEQAARIVKASGMTAGN